VPFLLERRRKFSIRDDWNETLVDFSEGQALLAAAFWGKPILHNRDSRALAEISLEDELFFDWSLPYLQNSKARFLRLRAKTGEDKLLLSLSASAQ
jgi:hypothetical protein